MTLTALSDEELVSRLEQISVEGHGLLARLLLHLIEVEERRLHLKAACSSLFDFCMRRLGMSEGAAFRRINAARLVQRCPSLLGRIERGDIHLSSLVLLRDHLTAANVDELVDAASGKNKREVQELLARRAPKADVPSTIRKLRASTSPPSASTAPRAQARIEPLSPARHKMQLTISTELRDKLERATALMRHRNPSGDLAVVVERALDALLEKLERETQGKTARPQSQSKPRVAAKPGHVERAVRREVFERDGAQCTFADAAGRRCPSRGFLEVDHVESRALGGSNEAANLRVFCRPHNLLHAEEVFGREYVARRVHFRQQKSRTKTSDAEPSLSRFDVATRGLVNMGFRETEARCALNAVSARHRAQDPALPVQELLREALAVLT